MGITAATQLSDFSGFLNPAQSAPIFDMAARMSVVQRLARQVPLGANGVAVPVITGKMSAGWVAEGTTKPASKGTMVLKTISPKKIASIAVVSTEVVRANPGGFMDTIRPQMAEAFSIAFDRAALRDEGPDGTPSGGPFSTWVGQTTKSVEIGINTEGIYLDIVDGLTLLVNNGKRLRGFALDDRIEPYFLGALAGRSS
jgi:HK97 family phage major capsid protein